jgi:ethanolamine transporter EutH
MRILLRLYPRRWRERYGEEFADLLESLSTRRTSARLVTDVCRGALDAHLRGGFGMRRMFGDPAVRVGASDGLAIAGLLAILVVLTNVVFPGGPDESDSDPEYVVQYLATVGTLAALLIAIGAHGVRRSASMAGAAKAGATAGAVVAVMVTLTFVVVNNLFLSIVSQQHDKRVAFAASGWTSMRAYLTVTQLQGGLFLVPVLALVGTILGLLGGAVFRPRGRGTFPTHAPHTPSPSGNPQ